MTDRYHSLTVILEKDIRSDDCKPLIDAIKMMKNVLKVRPSVTNVTDLMAQSRAKNELIEKIYKLLNSD